MTSIIKELINDKITLAKQSGERIEDIEACVQDNLISVFNEEIPFEVDDIIERKIPSGIVEKYKIIDLGFQKVPDAMKGEIPNHYQLKVEKLGRVKERRAQGGIKIYGDVIGSQIQHGSMGSSQDMKENIISIKEISEIEKLIPQLKLKDKEKEFREDLAKLKEEVSNKKDKSKIKKIISSLIKVLSGSASSIIATGILYTLKSLISSP